MITITAMKWAPPFAAGQVRDHRARWILNEVGWPYEVRLVDMPTLASAEYHAMQPFGQVPIMEEDGRPTLFETGAIVLDVAMRTGMLIPKDSDERSQTTMWVIAALNSIEPYLMNLAEVEFFVNDAAEKALRRPAALAMVEKRLGELQSALDGRRWLVGASFTVADLMVSSVLKIATSLGVLDNFPKLASYQERCFDRHAYRKAIEDQCASIAQHEMADMKYGGDATDGVGTPMSNDQRTIHTLLRDQEKAVGRGDADAAVLPMADDIVTYDLAPPLEHLGGGAPAANAFKEWLTTWDGGVSVELNNPRITVDGDLAVVHGLSRIQGTKKAEGPLDHWFRRTVILRRSKGHWRITHEHSSFPLKMDGSELAATDLEP